MSFNEILRNRETIVSIWYRNVASHTRLADILREAEAEAQAEAKAEAKAQAEAKAKAIRAEAEAEAKAIQEATAKAIQEATAKAIQEATAKAIQEATAEAEAVRKARREAIAKAKAEAKAIQEATAKAIQEATAEAEAIYISKINSLSYALRTETIINRLVINEKIRQKQAEAEAQAQAQAQAEATPLEKPIGFYLPTGEIPTAKAITGTATGNHTVYGYLKECKANPKLIEKWDSLSLQQQQTILSGWHFNDLMHRCDTADYNRDKAVKLAQAVTDNLQPVDCLSNDKAKAVKTALVRMIKHIKKKGGFFTRNGDWIETAYKVEIIIAKQHFSDCVQTAYVKLIENVLDLENCTVFALALYEACSYAIVKTLRQATGQQQIRLDKTGKRTFAWAVPSSDKQELSTGATTLHTGNIYSYEDTDTAIGRCKTGLRAMYEKADTIDRKIIGYLLSNEYGYTTTYVECEYTLEDIARLTGVTYKTVYRRLRELKKIYFKATDSYKY